MNCDTKQLSDNCHCSLLKLTNSFETDSNTCELNVYQQLERRN